MAASSSAPFSRGVSLGEGASLDATFERNFWISFSHREKAIWYARS